MSKKKTPKKMGPKPKRHKTPMQTGRAKSEKEHAKLNANVPKGKKRAATTGRIAERKAQGRSLLIGLSRFQLHWLKGRRFSRGEEHCFHVTFRLRGGNTNYFVRVQRVCHEDILLHHPIAGERTESELNRLRILGGRTSACASKHPD